MDGEWLNEPPRWQNIGGILRVETGERTDFWCRTHYGFVRDNGHFYHRRATGDFTAAVHFAAGYAALYDQAGLMVRADAENWLKCGIEYTDGGVHFSTVVTRDGFSDWSQQRIDAAAAEGLDVRVTRHSEALRVQFRLPGAERWTMARLAKLEMQEAVQAGPMCCTPERAGLTVRFEDFTLRPAISRHLHD